MTFDTQQNPPETATVEPRKQEEAVRLLPESDTRTPVLGSVNVNMLIRKNPDADFYRWADIYKSEPTQLEIKKALLLAGCVDGDVNRFIDNLNKPKTDNPEDLSNVAYDELVALIAKIRQRKEAYEKASEEAEGFKADVIFDSVKNFFNTQVIEGFKTKPIMTLAKIGVGIFLVSKLWGMLGDKKKYVYGAGAVAGAAWLLNGIVPPMLGKQGFDLSELLGLKPSVHSRELDWFCKQSGIESSRQRTGLLMRLTDVKIDKLVSLYIAGGTDVAGKGEIDITELLDDPDVSDEERVELQKLNTSTMRASLYSTVGKLIQLSGAKTPSEFAAMYPRQTLLSIIMQLYNGRPAGEVLSAMEDSVDTSKSEADKNLETILSRMGTIEDTEMYAANDKFWINDFPFDYYKVQENGLFISFGEVSELILTDDPVAFREAIVTFKDSTFELTAKAKGYIGKELTGYSGYTIDYKDNTWKVFGLRVEASPALGLASAQTVELEAIFTPEAYVEFKANGVEGTVKGAEMKETLMKAALSQSIKANGPFFCKDPEFKITSYDVDSGDININVRGTSVALKYKDGKYSFLSANFGEGRLLEYYRDGMASKSKSAVESGLAGLRYNGDEFLEGYNLISNLVGTDMDEYTEFRHIADAKSVEMGNVFASAVRNLDQDGTDLERRIKEAEDKLLNDLNTTLQEIARDFDSFKSAPDAKKISEEQFETDYIIRLQLAGFPSSYYKGEIQKLVDVLRSHDYAGIDKADLFAVGGTYYKVREKALAIFFKETGYIALKASPSSAEKELVSKTIQRITDALNAAESHGTWVDETVWMSEFDKLFPQTVEKTSSGSTETTPPSSPEVSPQPVPEVSVELDEASLDTKEKAFDEYKEYVGLYFDSLQGLVSDSNFDYGSPSAIQTILRALGASTAEMPSKDSAELQWKVLIDFKKEQYLKGIDTQKATFYNEYTALRSAGADVSAVGDMINQKVESSGLPQKVESIKNLAPQGAVYEDKYFEMLEALMFMDKPMFENLPSNPEMEKIYRDYTRGVFAQMLRTGSKSEIESRNLYMTALQNMDAYSGTKWQGSDAYLYTAVAEADKVLGASHPRNINAGYDVEAFMDLRYRRFVTSVNGTSAWDAHQKSEAIYETMSAEKRFLDEKAIFWKDIDILKLSQSIRQEAGKKEMSVHEVIFGLDVSEDMAVMIYKSTLNYMRDRLRENVSFDGDDLKDQIIKTAKSYGIILDKKALNVVG